MVHEQKFKDLLSSTCQVSVERIVLELESEAAWLLFPPGVTFCQLDFFHAVKPLMSILPILSIYEKLEWKCENLLGEKQPKFAETSISLAKNSNGSTKRTYAL